MNCWQFKKCGRIPDGENAAQMGVCPAYSQGAGQACWLVAGTFCGGREQGTFARKLRSCSQCDYYQTFTEEQRHKMRVEFRHLVLSKVRTKEYLL